MDARARRAVVITFTVLGGVAGAVWSRTRGPHETCSEGWQRSTLAWQEASRSARADADEETAVAIGAEMMIATSGGTLTSPADAAERLERFLDVRTSSRSPAVVSAVAAAQDETRRAIMACSQ